MEAREGKLLSSGSGEDAYEGQLFDELSRGLASGAISRRRALKLAGAAILGSTGLLSLMARGWGAERRRVREDGDRWGDRSGTVRRR
jgi:hypothetical protein